MKFIFLATAMLFSGFANAQDQTVKELKEASLQKVKSPTDTIVKAWKNGGFFNLNVNQGSLSNWSAGGDKFSFSLNAAVSLFSHYKKDRYSWDNTLDMTYGFLNTTSFGTRKSTDQIDFLSKYGYALNPKLDVAGLFNFRSQFAKGFNYEKTAAGADSAILTSKGFAPMYVLVSLGLNFKPNKDFSVFISPITARWVIVSDKLLAPLYSIESGKSSRQELGAFLSASYNKDFMEKFNFKTRLDLFSNYKSDPQNIDVYWTNILSAKITKYINFNLSVDVIYDDNTHNVNPDKGPAPQIMEQMGLGFSYNFKNYKP